MPPKRAGSVWQRAWDAQIRCDVNLTLSAAPNSMFTGDPIDRAVAACVRLHSSLQCFYITHIPGLSQREQKDITHLISSHRSQHLPDPAASTLQNSPAATAWKRAKMVLFGTPAQVMGLFSLLLQASTVAGVAVSGDATPQPRGRHLAGPRSPSFDRAEKRFCKLLRCQRPRRDPDTDMISWQRTKPTTMSARYPRS